jgi:hypothetical protein
MKYNCLAKQRKKILSTLSKSVSHLDGDFVECGVFIGSTAFYLIKNCKTEMHLFDSWEGISNLTDFDGESYKTNKWKCDISYAENKLKKYTNVLFYKGWIPSRFKEIENKQISLLHLDVSLYQPTKDSLDFFWDKMIPGGLVICNFHEGYSIGPEKAVRDFFLNKQELIEYSTGIYVVIK